MSSEAALRRGFFNHTTLDPWNPPEAVGVLARQNVVQQRVLFGDVDEGVARVGARVAQIHPQRKGVLHRLQQGSSFCFNLLKSSQLAQNFSAAQRRASLPAAERCIDSTKELQQQGLQASNRECQLTTTQSALSSIARHANGASKVAGMQNNTSKN